MVDDRRRTLGLLNFPEKVLPWLSQKRVFSYLNSYKQYSIIYALQMVVKCLAKVFYVVYCYFFFYKFAFPATTANTAW